MIAFFQRISGLVLLGFSGVVSAGLEPFPEPCTDTPVQVPTFQMSRPGSDHTGIFRGVLYDFPQPGQSTWYYTFTSGHRPAISHITFSLPCPTLRIVAAGMWDGEHFVNRNVNAGIPVPQSGAPSSDPTTQMRGLKFDLGFNDFATRNYFFTVNGNYAAEPMNVAFKAGPGFTVGQLCGPAGGCDDSEPPLALSSLGDRVWLDINANGIQDPGEAGVEGIEVRLLTSQGDFLRSTVTDGNGYYLFVELVEGEYIVEFVLEPGSPYAFTTPFQGGNSEEDSNADPVTGQSDVIVLQPDTHLRDVDAGLVHLTASVRISKEGVFVPGTLDPWAFCNVFGSAHAFNALIFGDFAPVGGDSEGRLAVGGNATFVGGYSVGYVVEGHPIPEQFDGTTDMLIVGGDLVDGSFGVNGNIVVGGNRSGPLRWMSNGNLLRHVNPIRFDGNGNVPVSGEGLTFAEMKAWLQARSFHLGQRPANGTVTQTSDWQWILEGSDPALNVFSVDEGEFINQELLIRAPAGATVLVNFTADRVEFDRGSITFDGPVKEHVIFNLPNASLYKTSHFQTTASLLAPFADGDFIGGSIDGRAVFGGSVVSEVGFEFHNFKFEGEICLDPVSLANPPSIAYTFTVENTGDVPLSNVRVVDPLVPVSGGPVDLLPGEIDSLTFTALLTLSAVDFEEEDFVNTARVYAETPTGHFISHKDAHVLVFPEPEPFIPPVTGEYPVGNLPDFVVHPLEIHPTLTAPGQTFSVKVIVSNQGDKPGDAGTLRVWPALRQHEPQPDDGYVEVQAGHFSVGEVKSFTLDGLTTSDLPGHSIVRADVNFGRTTLEYSYGNNVETHYEWIEDQSAPWMKPDFVVRSVSLSPAPVTTGARFRATVVVANEGSQAGDAGTLGLWPAHPEYTRDLPDPVLQTAVGPLAVGEVKQIVFDNLVAPGQFGTFHTLAVVHLEAREGDELSILNNHAGATFSLHPVVVEMTAVENGNSVSWNSSPGFLYFVERSTSLDGEFEQIASNLPATAPLNIFVDTDPPVGGLVFYRVWGYKP